MRNSTRSIFTETRLIRAYLALFLAPTRDDVTKTVTLARFGAYEVRLIELARTLCGRIPPVWIELYAHDLHCSLDSCGCEEFDEASTSADELISQAKELHRCSEQDRAPAIR